MKASFVTGFHTARIENLLQTLRFLTEDHLAVTAQSQLVTLCQDSIENLPQEKVSEFQKLQQKFGESIHNNLSLEEMSLPKLTNYGVSCATSDKIIILESDRILPKDYFEKVLKELKPKVCITTKFMKKLTAPATDEEIRKNDYDYKEEHRSETNQIGMRNMWSGNTAVWKDDYMEAGMMDENYIGYGWADTDMHYRMDKIGVQNQYWDDIELHLWHPPATYGKSDQKNLFLNNGVRFCKKWGLEYPDWFRKELYQHGKIML